MIRKAQAVWRGTGRAGNGNLTTDSGVLAETPYSFRTRFENEKGTNPEELIAAAHAGCFTMALAFDLQGAGFTPTELATEAAVTLEPEDQGFRITRSALVLRAKVPDLDEATFARLAGLAPTLTLVANSPADQAAGWSAAKRETRVLATEMPANHSATRTKLMAAAVIMCWRCVLARPM